MTVVAYKVYLDGVLVATVDAPITDVALQGLDLGTAHTIAVSSIDDAGNESPLSELEAFTVLGLVEGAGVSDAIGRIVTASEVEAAVMATLDKWLPAYLDETQRQAIQEMPIAYPELYRAIDDPAHDAAGGWPGVSVSADLDEIEPSAESETHVYTARVWLTVSGGTQASTRRLIDAYAAATASVLRQNAALGGLAASTTLAGIDREAPSEATTAYALVSLRVVVEDAARRYSHATEPPDPGVPLPADLPVHLISIDEQLV